MIGVYFVAKIRELLFLSGVYQSMTWHVIIKDMFGSTSANSY